MASVQRPCQAFNLGVIKYQGAFQLQKRLQLARVNGNGKDRILILQHYPVITLGKSGNTENVTVTDEFLAQKGVTLVDSDRGGDVTFHNPGQLVVYPIFDLRVMYGSTYYRCIYQYVRDLEEVVLRLLSDFGIVGHRARGYPGVWVSDNKICAIGLNVSHWVTMHGFALNVNNDLQFGSYIHSCGIRGKRITSVSEVLHCEIMVDNIIPSLLENLSNVFNLDIHYETCDMSYSGLTMRSNISGFEISAPILGES